MSILSDALLSATATVATYDEKIISDNAAEPQNNRLAIVEASGDIATYYDNVNGRLDAAVTKAEETLVGTEDTFVGVNILGDRGEQIRPVIQSVPALDVAGLPTGTRINTSYAAEPAGTATISPNGYYGRKRSNSIFDANSYPQIIDKFGQPIYANSRGSVDPLGDSEDMSHWLEGNRSDENSIYPAGMTVAEMPQLGPFMLWEPKDDADHYKVQQGSGGPLDYAFTEMMVGAPSSAFWSLLTHPFVTRFKADVSHDVTLPFLTQQQGRSWNNSAVITDSMDNGDNTLPYLTLPNRLLNNITWESYPHNGISGNPSFPLNYNDGGTGMWLNWERGVDTTYTQGIGTYELFRFGFWEIKLGAPNVSPQHRRRVYGRSIGYITPMDNYMPVQ